jgi:hypothetical protein
MEKSINEGISLRVNFRLLPLKQHQVYRMYCQVVFKNGKPVELLGTFQDITNEQNLINELQYNVENSLFF